MRDQLLPVPNHEPHWYAVHTRARHEKLVAEQLLGNRIEHFLPLYSAVHRWKDRNKCVQIPLFPGYLFVRIDLKNRLQVLRIPGVAEIVQFMGVPAPLPEREMQTLRTGLAANLRAEPFAYLKVGRRIRIRSGVLEGAEGILVRKKSSLRLVLSIDLIMRSVAVEVDAADIEPIPDNAGRWRAGHSFADHHLPVSN